MLTLAQLIKLVLDEAYQEIKGEDDAAKDRLISKRLASLSASYGNLVDETREEIDYSTPSCRFAYIYKYTVAHADYIKQLIGSSGPLSQLFKKPDIAVACLGGGPGSDLLGILKHMMQQGSKSTLTCYLFDRERAWGDSWSEVARKLEAKFHLYPIFQQLDVTDGRTWKSYTKFLRSDLFTLSYFLSEVWAFKESAEPYFNYCFRNANHGAYFLFIDNNDSRFVDWYDSLAATNGLKQISANTCEMAFSIDEEKLDLEPYYSKFDWPKRKSNVCYRISQKQ
jgi:hypothetical protein